LLQRALPHEVLRAAASLAVPAAVLALAYPLLINLDLGGAVLRAVAPSLTYGLISAAIALGLWFHRSRAAFIGLLVLLGHWMVQRYFTGGLVHDVYGQVVYAAYAVLLPVNALFFVFLAERGMFTERGAARLAMVALQVAVVAAIAGAGVWLDADSATTLQTIAADLLHMRVLPKAFDYWSPLPQPAIQLFAVVLGILLVRALVRDQGPLDGGLFGAVSAAALALNSVGPGPGATVFFAAAGLILVVAVVQDSYRMAFLDELTGLPGRRALLTALAKLGGRYTLVMLDVDHFKKFNDTYGHDVGDQVLRMVAARMQRVAGGGRPYRYGGEEFTLVFPGKRKEDAYRYLEELRLAIADDPFVIRGENRPARKPDRPAKAARVKTARITVSMGVAEPDEMRPTPDDVLKLADKALYRAKDAGRNRISA
jgi:diguanylate cyclase (GGDEF)-like protein